MAQYLFFLGKLTVAAAYFYSDGGTPTLNFDNVTPSSALLKELGSFEKEDLNLYPEWFKARKKLMHIAVKMHGKIIDKLALSPEWVKSIERYGISVSGYDTGGQVALCILPLLSMRFKIRSCWTCGAPKVLHKKTADIMTEKYDIKTYQYGNDPVPCLGWPWEKHPGSVINEPKRSFPWFSIVDHGGYWSVFDREI